MSLSDEQTPKISQLANVHYFVNYAACLKQDSTPWDATAMFAMTAVYVDMLEFGCHSNRIKSNLLSL